MARTPQMNIRVPADLQARLYAAARRRGVSRSILVRSALEDVASSPPVPFPPGVASMPVGNASSEPQAADTDFVTWIAAQTHLPHRSCSPTSLEDGFASTGASAVT